MPDIPDKVIEQATLRLDRAAHQQTCAVHGYSGEPMRDPEGDVMWSLKAGVLAAAPVIAAWARAEERERIREAIKARATEREAEMLEADRKASYKDSPDWAGIRDEKAAMSDELQSLLDDEPALTVLDRDGSDIREGER